MNDHKRSKKYYINLNSKKITCERTGIQGVNVFNSASIKNNLTLNFRFKIITVPVSAASSLRLIL